LGSSTRGWLAKEKAKEEKNKKKQQTKKINFLFTQI
jgi:hypothetical protein